MTKYVLLIVGAALLVSGCYYDPYWRHRGHGYYGHGYYGRYYDDRDRYYRDRHRRYDRDGDWDRGY